MASAAKLVALVTGGTRGIGRETCKQLAEKGFIVLLGGRDQERGTKIAADMCVGNTNEVHFIHIELTDETTIAAAAAEVVSKYQRLDVLINNGAIMIHDNGIIPINMAKMREEFEVNFYGTVAVTNAMLPIMLSTSPAPRIVMVTSRLGTHATLESPENKYSNPNYTSYKCSKAALNMYTHALAKYLKDRSAEAGGSAALAKVNGCYPGFVRTDMSNHEAPMDVTEGAETSVYLATLPADGPTGGFYHKQEKLNW